jgi:hypothetical protein
MDDPDARARRNRLLGRLMIVGLGMLVAAYAVAMLWR